MKKIIVLLTSVIFLANTPIKATAIIAIIRPDRIILSVDSRITATNDATGNKLFLNGGKLSTVANYAFAFTGYRGFAGKASPEYKNFNTDLYIKSILAKNHKTLSEKFSELMEGLQKELTEQMRIYKRLNTKAYNASYGQNKSSFVNLIVIGDDKGTPFAFALKATIKEDKGIPQVKAEASVFENKSTILLAGVTDAVARYLVANPLAIQKEEPVALIDKLMIATIKDKPFEAGQPIDIIQCTKIGLSWVRRKKDCLN